MILEEIPLGKDTESKRKAISDLLGKQVFLIDSHESWVHGILLHQLSFDKEVYEIIIADGRGHIELNYHDLQQLFLLKPYKNNPLPKIGYASPEEDEEDLPF